MTAPENDFEIQILGYDYWEEPEGRAGEAVLLHTTRGDVRTLLHHEAETPAAIVWVWGARGGFDGPANGIYGVLAEELKSRVISLRVDYRQPNVLHECVLDTLAGVTFLKAAACTRVLLVGHSFGGAVVISAAPLNDVVTGVVALSSQTYGAANAASVAPKPLLLIHGAEDSRLSYQCSEQIYEWAQDPKELVIYPDAGHGLTECATQLHDLLTEWIVDKLEVPA